MKREKSTNLAVGGRGQPKAHAVEFRPERARRIRVGLALTVGALLGAGAAPVRAIDIVLTYDSGSSEPPISEPPSGDTASGTRLQAIMERAAAIWEAALPGATPVINVKYWWKEDPTGFLGFHDPDIELGRTEHNFATGSNNIRFFVLDNDGNEIPWFIDPTPSDDSEFDDGFEQTLRAAVAGGGGVVVPTSSSVAPLEDMLELSYEGYASDSSDADGCADLLSVALHELGHAIGLRGPNLVGYLRPSSTLTSPFLCSSGSCVIRITTNSSGAHLDADCLMQQNLTAGVRRYPSQVDVLALAACRNLTTVNFGRKEMLPQAGSSSGLTMPWNLTGNWFGGRLPTGSEDAYIRHTLIDEVYLGVSVSARNLYLGRYAPLGTGPILLRTQARTLTVAKTATIDGSATEFRVESGGKLNCGAAAHIQDSALLRVKTSGRVEALAGTVLADSGALELEGGTVKSKYLETNVAGEVRGYGTCEGIHRLTNDGRIRAVAGDLTLRAAASTALFDLDGADAIENGELEAEDGSISCDGRMADAFNSFVRVAQTLTLSNSYGWTLGSGGELYFTESTDPEVVAPKTIVDQYGTLRSEALRARIDGELTFKKDSYGFAMGADDSLVFLDYTLYEGGLFQGGGTIHQVGDSVIAGNSHVRMEVSVFNWDGENWLPFEPFVAPRMVVQNTGIIEIVYGTSATAGDGYDGIAHVSPGGTLRVYQDWQLDGTLCVSAGGLVEGGTITVAPGAVIIAAGTINANIVNYGTVYNCGGALTLGPGKTITGPGAYSSSCPGCP